MKRGLDFFSSPEFAAKGLSPNPDYGNEREIRFLQDKALEPEEADNRRDR
jgi:hypothetical protein